MLNKNENADNLLSFILAKLLPGYLFLLGYCFKGLPNILVILVVIMTDSFLLFREVLRAAFLLPF